MAIARNLRRSAVPSIVLLSLLLIPLGPPVTADHLPAGLGAQAETSCSTGSATGDAQAEGPEPEAEASSWQYRRSHHQVEETSSDLHATAWDRSIGGYSYLDSGLISEASANASVALTDRSDELDSASSSCEIAVPEEVAELLRSLTTQSAWGIGCIANSVSGGAFAVTYALDLMVDEATGLFILVGDRIEGGVSQAFSTPASPVATLTAELQGGAPVGLFLAETGLSAVASFINDGEGNGSCEASIG